MQQLLDMNRDIMFSVRTQNVMGGLGLLPAPDMKMLYRGSYIMPVTGTYISVVNKNYCVVENRQVLEPLQKQMIDYFDPIVLEDVQIKDTILKNGKVCYSEYIFPKIKYGIETDVGHKTDFGLRFVIKNSFDGKGSVIMWSGLIDFFCTNGTVTGKYDVTRKRHSRNFNTDGFINAFEVTMNNHKEIVDGYQRLADKKVKHEQVVNLFNTLTKVKDRLRSGTLSEKLSNQYNVERYSRGDNAFAVMSAMTHYASHGTGRFNLTRTGDQGTLYKRQEKVTNWLRSDTWKEFVAEAA